MPADTRHEGPGYEQTDVYLRALWRPLLGLAVLVVFGFVLMDWLLGGLETFREPKARETGWIGLRPENQIPPEPRLQVNPSGDAASLRAEERRLLEGYGWVNEADGIVRIPVERAMEIVVERGLPHRGETR